MSAETKTKAAEIFLKDYLAEKLRLQKLWAMASQPMQERFFMHGYAPSDLQARIKQAESETILGSVDKTNAIEITTTGNGKHHRVRYRLVPQANEFRIALVELQCGLCSRGGGGAKCHLCGGAGWFSLPMKAAPGE